MNAGKEARSGDCNILQVLDEAAGLIIEARVLLLTLPMDRRKELQLLSDLLLTGIGRQIAAELPPSAIDSVAL